ANSGRPGPCWLDIPIDVQSSFVDEDVLKAFNSHSEPDPSGRSDEEFRVQVTSVLERLRNAKRPVIMAGTGVRLAGAVELFNRVVHKLGIPVTTAWTHDLIASDDPFFCGRPGTIGTRAGNFTVQNADVLLVLGSRLNIRQTGYAWKSFARAAYKIWVDIDPSEFAKPTVKPDMPVQSDMRCFLEELEAQIDSGGWNASDFVDWLGWCKERMQRYPPVLPKHREFRERINPYHFMEVLFEQLEEDDVVVCGNATACIVPFQAGKLKMGQRMFSNSGAASMGYDLPAAIGAAVAREGKRVICLAGDGSLQLNIQELQTVVHYNLPIKIFVLNNNGYLSIRTSQKGFFNAVMGESPASGVSFPNMMQVAEAYGIPSYRLDMADFATPLREVMRTPGAVICDVLLDLEQAFEPRQSSRQLPDGRIVSAPLEDMFPFLEREELLGNLLIPAWEE
ncbi:MAG: thiamine pyrophosphate-binding protein, partial [Anaerolineae bacterium]|nr:thiamine pyrophosphate-binding protein [Anaerolineae bacterium]